jgi:predicted O-linked N-acetylglucosamine transferase (SPINDLY family)
MLKVDHLTNARAVAVGRSLQPHVVIDLQALVAGGRPEMMTRRIAPVQATYLVYPGTVGCLQGIDYAIVDRIITPVELAKSTMAERLAVLPGSYQLNWWPRDMTHLLDAELHRRATGARARAGPRGMNGGKPFVFAALSKHSKIQPAAFRVWCSILRRVPSSRLWMLEPPGGAASAAWKNLMDVARATGVSASRFKVLPRVSKEQHMLRQADADLMLDLVYGYGAHSTASDSLRSGLPVLTTLSGATFASRVALSVVTSLNLGSISVGVSARDYEGIASRLASSPALATAIARKLATAVTGDGARGSALDGEQTTRHIERMAALLHEVDRAQCVSGSCHHERIRDGRMHVVMAAYWHR